MKLKFSGLHFSALGTVITFLLCTAIAILSKPSYKIGFQYLSDLGVGSGAFWFNYGLILTAVFLFAFFFFLRPLFNNLIGKGGIIFGMIAAIALITVGLFPENLAPQHFFASVIFFALTVLSVALISISLNMQKTLHLPTFFFGGLVVLSGVILFFTLSPLSEYITVASFGLWLLTIARFPLTQK